MTATRKKPQRDASPNVIHSTCPQLLVRNWIKLLWRLAIAGATYFKLWCCPVPHKKNIPARAIEELINEDDEDDDDFDD